ncbi:MAG: efflux RND transporter periplasmic adaptor subunit [Bryobacterales bacterium]|nr:efflux RND transporter periplasmic adaptor subunit [Bryobacterales bacterium]
MSVLYRCGIATSVVLLAACSREAPPGTTAGAGTAESKATPVATAVASRQPIQRQMTLSAEFRPFEEVELHAKVAGFLREITVDVGDRVQKGQRLATLEVPEMTEDIAQAAAGRARSEADVVRARVDLQRSETTAKLAQLSFERLSAVLKSRPNLIAQQEIDEAKTRADAAREQVEAARAALAASQQQVRAAAAGESRARMIEAYSRITAPFAGVITRRYVHPGAMIPAGTSSQATPVVRLSNDQRLRLVVPLPESAIPSVQLGSRVAVRVPTLNQTFSGSVARFSNRVVTSSRTMETEIDVPNPRLLLKAGMFAETDIVLERRNDALVIPQQAVVNLSTRPQVYVVDAEKRIAIKPVKAGIQSAEGIEILEGLAEGDIVVTAGQNRLRTGQLVVLPAPSQGGA